MNYCACVLYSNTIWSCCVPWKSRQSADYHFQRYTCILVYLLAYLLTCLPTYHLPTYLKSISTSISNHHQHQHLPLRLKLIEILHTIHNIFTSTIHQPSIMSSPPSPPQNPLRSSKFIEGSPLTPPDLLRRPTALNNILAEMDVYEQQRKHRGSSSSIESLDSALPAPIMGKPEKRKSFTRLSLGDMDRIEVKREKEEKSTLKVKVKGRLRALTGGNPIGRPWEHWGTNGFALHVGRMLKWINDDTTALGLIVLIYLGTKDIKDHGMIAKSRGV